VTKYHPLIQVDFCNLSDNIALNVWFTTNGMWVKTNTHNTHIGYLVSTSNNRVISIVACCYSVKLYTHAARAFQLQQNDAVTMMWRSCQLQLSQKECAIGAAHCEKEGMLLQPVGWHCVECANHHERDVYDGQTHIYVVQTSKNRVTSSGDLYCCLQPQCEALRTCCSGFMIATVSSLSLDQFYQSGLPNGTIVLLQPLISK